MAIQGTLKRQKRKKILAEELTVTGDVSLTGAVTLTDPVTLDDISAVDITATGTVSLGSAAASQVGFHGVTGTAATKHTGTIYVTSNVVSATEFGTAQVALVQAIMNVLNNHGLSGAS